MSTPRTGQAPALAPGLSPLLPFGLSLKADSGALLSDEDVHSLRQLVWKHRLVVLRGYRLMKPDQLVEYCRSWGDLLAWDFGYVLDLRAHEQPKNYLFTRGNVPFHWDGAFATRVPSFQMFQCLEAPDCGAGGETLFCDTTLVWNGAGSKQREQWACIQITYTTDKLAHYGGQVTAPLVACHPHTGEPTLRFAEELNEESVPLNPLFLDVHGTPPGDEGKLCSELSRALHRPEVCYAHAWRQGDILIADNHALLHGRNPFSEGVSRHLQRVHIL